jgi:hypothetical protein
MYYESPDITKQPELDLKKNLPHIPSFQNIFSRIKDLDYITAFYQNRMGLIKELIAHTKDELATQNDPTTLKARKEFYTLLLEAEAKVDREFAVAERYRLMET